MPRQARGKFVDCEGLDGSGLTEQVDLLKNWLRKSGRDLSRVEFTHEPSEGPLGLLPRMTLQGCLDMGLFQSNRKKTGLALPGVASRLITRFRSPVHFLSD